MAWCRGECSTAGRQRLGGISRAGDERLRQLLVLGATAVIQHAKPGRPATSPWLLNLLGRKPRKLAAVALANKIGPQSSVGHDDARGGLPAAAGRRLTARLPRVQGLREKMLIGRSDDPHNPCRVAASKVSASVWEWIAEPIWASGLGRNKQAGHTTATARGRGKTRLQTTAGRPRQSDRLGVSELVQALRSGSPAAAVRHR